MTRRPIANPFDADDIFASVDDDDDDAAAERMPERLARAIALVPHLDKFYGHFLRGLRIERRDNLGSVMATNCVDAIYYDAEAINSAISPIDWTPPLLACVIVHECMHILRCDGEFFFKAGDKDLANVALDACINRTLIEESYRFPGVSWANPEDWARGRPGPIAAESWDFRTAPEIYNRLKEMREKEQAEKEAQANAQGGTADKPDAFGGAADSDILGDEYQAARKKAGGADGVKRKVRRMAAAASAAAEADGAGGSQAGPADEIAAGDGTTGGAGGFGGYGTTSPATQAMLQDLGVVAKAPKNLLSTLAGSAIRGILTSKRTRSRTIMRPSPMTDVYGYVVPGRKARHDVLPAVAIDMSSSIDHETLCRFVGEAQLWIRQYVGRSTRIPCAFFNTEITRTGSLSDFRIGDNVPAPNGGTDFRPIWDWLAGLPQRPSHVLVWTDLAAPFPPDSAGIQTIWIAPPVLRGRTAPFGTVIHSE